MERLEAILIIRAEMNRRPYGTKLRKELVLEACQMACEALEREQNILDAGYTGKENRFYIGGRLFGIKELPQ